MSDTSAIETLLDDAWREYDAAVGSSLLSGYVVQPSVPILWFGDLDAYLASPLKVITVGLNPSDAEFGGGWYGSWYSRFPSAAEIHGPRNQQTRGAILRQALNEYFRQQPYRDWFDRGFEPVLNGMGASFYSSPVYPSVVVHTDLCSPLATAPTWSGLKKESPSTVRTLGKTGSALWNRLVRALTPNIVILSVGEEWIDLMELDPDDDLFDVAGGAGGFWTRLSGARTDTLVVRQSSITSPYKSLPYSVKGELGRTILKTYRTVVK